MKADPFVENLEKEEDNYKKEKHDTEQDLKNLDTLSPSHDSCMKQQENSSPDLKEEKPFISFDSTLRATQIK